MCCRLLRLFFWSVYQTGSSLIALLCILAMGLHLLTEWAQRQLEALPATEKQG
jgi:hypothetical protein